VVLSKTKEFCSVFHGLIREKQVKKVYLALTTAPVSIGIITHYMRPVNRAPRLVSEDMVDYKRSKDFLASRFKSLKQIITEVKMSRVFGGNMGLSLISTDKPTIIGSKQGLRHEGCINSWPECMHMKFQIILLF